MPSHRLVVSRFREEVSWAEAFGTYTIYNKGRDDLPARVRSNSIRLPNVGREAHTYIHHIVENYDKLEDIIIFSQGGYAAHVNKNPEEFFRASLDIEERGFSVNLADKVPALGSNARSFVLNWHGTNLYTKEPYNLGEWWEKTTGEAWIRSKTVFWSATFSVKREFILRRSRESYIRLLKTLDWSQAPMEAHFCERSWFNILNLPMDFFAGEIPVDPDAEVDYQEDKDPDFGVKSLVERWEGHLEKDDRPRITVRRRKAASEATSDSLLTRAELVGFLDHTRDLMKEDEATVRSCTEALRQNIEEWTRQNCPNYPVDKDYVDKSDLAVKDGWYVGRMAHESMEVGTTGSTTGFSFRYMRWQPSFHKIEWDYHYNFVLDEFDVRENPNILYFFSDHFKSDGVEPIACFGNKSELPWNNHGTSRSPTTHYVNFPIYQKNQEEFFRHMFDYVQRHEIDVLFTSPPQISSMCNYIRKFGIKHRIGALLSSTGDRILPADAKFLFIDNRYFDHICDHMRCWDGGATFYTCKHRNYHLMDNLSWVEEIDGKMICTDYFNLSSPFVRYWNGDYCRISKEYQRCDCGRLYREFEFMESRPFSLKGVCMSEIKSGLKELKVPGIKEVRCAQTHLDVVSVVPVSHEDRLKIAALSDKFPFRFITEEFHS
jgi:hypothetical protein